MAIVDFNAYKASLETAEALDLVSNRHIRSKIVSYLLNKYYGKISEEQAEIIAQKMVYKIIDINVLENGGYDRIIGDYVREFSLRNNSVQKESEQRVYTPLKSKKKEVDPKKFLLSTILSLAVVAGLSVGMSELVNNVKDEEVSVNLGKLASDYYNVEYRSGQSIVAQNITRVTQKDGTIVSSYNHNNIAKDIIMVCSRNPQLFELCMNDIYRLIGFKNLENMDIIFHSLKEFLETDESLQVIFDQIKDYDTFLEYVMSRGLITKENKQYDELMRAIEEYKQLRKENPNQLGIISMLSNSATEAIRNLMKEYEDSRAMLYNEFAVILDSTVKDYEESQQPTSFNFGG